MSGGVLLGEVKVGKPGNRAVPASIRNSIECCLRVLCREKYDCFDCMENRVTEVKVGDRLGSCCICPGGDDGDLDSTGLMNE